jgi:hypothetical protein
MLIVIYDNNMFRLWNLLDGRCIFKRKLGLDPETNKVVHKAIQCKWEPTNGLNYAILYEKKMEVFTAERELPVSSITSDTNLRQSIEIGQQIGKQIGLQKVHFPLHEQTQHQQTHNHCKGRYKFT